MAAYILAGCIGFSLGLASAAIVVWCRDCDPTRWTHEDQHRLMREKLEPYKDGNKKVSSM